MPLFSAPSSSRPIPRRLLSRRLLLAAALLPTLPLPPRLPLGAASAQAAPSEAGRGPGDAPRREDTRPPLPAVATTHHTLALPGRTLAFTATAESFRLVDDKGAPQADIAVLSYALDGADPARRPVAFVFNGGPGASSAWLQLGALGPWRLDLSRPPAPSNSATPIPNPETWLDFADLVFIDPPGTGYSRLATDSEALRRKFYSVEGDITALAEVVRRWTLAHGRAAAPHLLVGESYGGFRAPRLARTLQTGVGLGVKGLMLVSPVLDFGAYSQGADPMALVARLPSEAAIAAEAAGRVPDLAAAEAYARGDFLADLLRGPRDGAAVERLVAHLAPLTGLDPELLRRHAGRLDLATFRRARVPGAMASLYDATLSDPDAAPYAAWSEQPDAVLDALRAPLTAAMMELYRRFGWQTDGASGGRYEVLSDAVWRAWEWGHRMSLPSALPALRTALALDPALRVTILHGRSDLVTPYFGTKLLLEQLPPIGEMDRLRLEIVPGGHMLYLRDAARQALRTAGERLLDRPE